MKEKEKTFNEHLKRWSIVCPYGESRVADLYSQGDSPDVSLVNRPENILNLLHKNEMGSFFAHSVIDPLEEAKNWFSSLYLKDVSVIYVYGVGLGYYYEACLNWLKVSEDNCLVFLEDDPQVIRYILEIDRSHNILYDPQVFIYLIDSSMKFDYGMQSLVSLFFQKKYLITALNSKLIQYPNKFNSLTHFINLSKDFYDDWLTEIFNLGNSFYFNCFSNYLDIPSSYFGNHLFNKFKDIPAIICGAGPSLNKNIDVLAGLTDRALIFAGGTALNALNGKNVTPHFGAGLDPNEAQLSRLIMNKAFELPFFYKVRMLHKALKMVHGDKLYVANDLFYKISEWLEKCFGIEEEALDLGFNVLNFTLSLAQALGCNPIICVGIDLSYGPNGESYAEGVINHPMHNYKNDFRTRSCLDETLIKKDINGTEVTTQWQWIKESAWYSEFQAKFPSTLLINACEGGIGFFSIENMLLKDVADKYLTKQYDFNTLIQGELQNSQFPNKICNKNIIASYDLLNESLLESIKILNKTKEFILNIPLEEFASKGFQQEIEKNKIDLEKQVAYKPLISFFELEFDKINYLKKLQIKLSEGLVSQEDLNKKKQSIEISKIDFFLNLTESNRAIINYILFKNRNDPTEDLLKKTISLTEGLSSEKYFFDEKTLKISEPDKEINFYEVLKEPLIKESENYPSQVLKSKRYYKEKVVAGKKQLYLHGPSQFFSESQQRLAEAWFWEGKQQGIQRNYYLMGQLHSIQNFKNGLKEGDQSYFYENGVVKSFIQYKEGLLQGEVKLYFPEGGLFRSLQFLKGKREGTELILNEKGDVVLECYYKNDKPLGKLMLWHDNAILAKEMVYDENSICVEIKEWSREGVLITKVEDNKGDYFDQVNQKTLDLTSSLEEAVKCVLAMNSKETNIESLKALEQEMKNLKIYEELIEAQMKKDREGQQESLWKAPIFTGLMDQNLDVFENQLKEEMKKMQEGLSTIRAHFESEQENKE